MNAMSLFWSLLLIGSHCFLTEGKIFEKCELARKMRQLGVPSSNVPIMVCIAAHESNYNTEALNHSNEDGSTDHGILQINDRYWCGNNSPGGGCNIECSDLEDDDIADDVACSKKIFKETQRFKGDGYAAWTVYKHFCKGQTDYIEDC